MKNMNMANKLVLTFSSILALFLIASIILFIQLSTMMNSQEYFYEHPFRVTNAARDLKAELLQMRILAKDIIMDVDNDLIDEMEKSIAASELKVQNDISILKQQYLGSQKEISLLMEKFEEWRVIKDHVISLAKRGDTVKAADTSVHKASAAANEMIGVLDGILEYANKKADGFHQEVHAANQRAVILLVVFLALSFAVSLLLAFFLTRSILKPLDGMMNVIRRVEQGEEAIRVEVDGRRDEFGKLTGAFNRMLLHLKTQKELQEMAWTLERQRTLEQFRITLLSIGDAVISTDREGNIANMNSAAEKLTGWALKDCAGSHIDNIFHIVNAKTNRSAENPLQKVLKQGVVVGLANHTVLISKSGERYHISDSAAPILDDEGHLTGVVLVFRDVTEEYRRSEEISYMSFHDKLTGLFNRAFLEEEIQRLNAQRRMPLSIIMADINGLKLINDAFGHQMGDRYLITAADTLKKCCRSDDVIARWGGDEFVLLLPNTAEEESQRICSRIFSACQEAEGFPIRLSMSLGCAVAFQPDEDYQQALKEAETNMYRHKLLESRSVRNAIVASLAKSLNEKDYYTQEHALSMVDTCKETGIYLGLKDSTIDELELLANLHDIGKIAISESILLKPGRLDIEEWAEMKKHVEIGFRIANSIAELEHIAEGILMHHERWDGTGYPKGLSGEDIPYSARIISVADAYDAMTRGRPYKLAISHEEAVLELKRCAGSQFDPVVVNAFIKALESRAAV